MLSLQYRDPSIVQHARRVAALSVGVAEQIGWDGRDHPGHTTRGTEGTLSAAVYHQMNGNEYSFFKSRLDVRRYIHLFYDRVLILRVAGEITTHLSDDVIPFYYLSEIGHRSTVRGFDRGRFRDKDSALASIEYRWPIWKLMDGLLFVDTGQVANDIYREFDRSDLQWSWGGGVRLWGSDGMTAKLEVGRSSDGTRIHFVMF